MNDKIWLSSPHMGENELKYVQEAFETNWIAPLGPHVNAVEENINTYIGGKSYVAALNTGTAAIHLALIQLGVQRGDTVLCSSFTFVASCNPIVYLGAEPVFIDSERETWNMSPELLEEAIIDLEKKGNKPKAIVLVHLYGMPAKMEELMAVANKYNVPVVEDAAEALGSTYKGKALGTFGEFGVFSFNGNKIITGSAGGVLISPSGDKIARTRFLSTQARDAEPHFQHSEIGYNYRMSNICAAIIRGQIEVLDERVARRREIHFLYKKAIGTINGVTFLEEPNEDYFSNHWLSCLLIDENITGVSKEEVRLFLEKNNVEARPLWKPMHLQPVFEGCKVYENGTAEELFNTGLCLPSGSNMTNEDVDRVIGLLKLVLLNN